MILLLFPKSVQEITHECLRLRVLNCNNVDIQSTVENEEIFKDLKERTLDMIYII